MKFYSIIESQSAKNHIEKCKKSFNKIINKKINVMENFNFFKKANYPYTYGDNNSNEKMLSEFIFQLMLNKKFQNYTKVIFFVVLTLGNFVRPVSAIPIEYGKTVDNILNQVMQNNEFLETLTLDQIQGQVSVSVAQPNAHPLLFEISKKFQTVNCSYSNTLIFTIIVIILSLNIVQSRSMVFSVYGSKFIGIVYQTGKKFIKFIIKN